ncbi:MAG: hypothetical protein GVY20_17735 [Bacteroidetes bacterium]|jgi:hypothetical protein|nr:hypothetical protein [Bacteroidota bacterium]
MNKSTLIRYKNEFFDTILRIGVKINLPFSFLSILINQQPRHLYSWVSLDSIKDFVPNIVLEDLFSPLEVRKPNVKDFIWCGDWDVQTKSIQKFYSDYSIAYRSILQIFDEGIDYKSSDEYKKLLNEIEKDGSSVRAKSRKELDEYFENLLILKKDLEKNGYKTKEDLKGKKSDEIGVFVGRDGSIIKAEDNFSGTHRFAIAKVLGISKVFVKIIAVHEIWAQKNLGVLVRSLSTQEIQSR